MFLSLGEKRDFPLRVRSKLLASASLDSSFSSSLPYQLHHLPLPRFFSFLLFSCTLSVDQLPVILFFIMDSSQIYAIAVGGTFGLLLLINCLPLIVPFVNYITPLVSKYLIYSNVLHRHRFVGPWSGAGVLIQLLYITGNLYCLKFWNTSTSQAGLQAGTLAVINLIPAFASPHLSTLADLLGVSLSTFRKIHRSAGVMVVVLTIFHVLVVVARKPSFPMNLPQNLFAVIVSILRHLFLY
jgi:hypothetical protein